MMIFRLSFLVLAASSAAALFHHNNHSSDRQHPHATRKDVSVLQHIQEEDKIADELSEGEAEMDSEKLSPRNYGRTANNAHLSRTSVKELETKKLILEERLIELNGLKRYWSSISQLKRNVEETIQEIQMLNHTIDSLKVDRNDLEKELKKGLLAAKQLEKSKSTMQKMQRALDANGNNLKGQLSTLQHQVSGFQSNQASKTDSMVDQKLIGVELELLELKRENKELQLGKRELLVKLVSTQARVAALSNLTEANSEVIAKINSEIYTLNHANEDLSKQIETLQKDRFVMVEELVYQRWLSTCLRFDIQDHKTPTRKPSNRVIKTDSRRRLDFNLDSTSSNSSTTYSSNDNDSCSMMSSSSSSQRSIAKKSSFLHRLKKWGTSKDAVASPERSSSSNISSRKGLIRRFSTSMVPPKPSMGNSPGNENSNPSKRARRVSFSDAVKTIEPITHENVSESDSYIDSDSSSHTSFPNVNATLHSKPGMAEDEYGLLSPQSSDVAGVGSDMDVTENDGSEDNILDSKMDEWNENARSNLRDLHSGSTSVQPGDSKVDIYILHVVVALLLLFMLFAILLRRIC